MAKIYQALQEIDKFESLAKRNQWMNRIHPLVKLLLSIFYIVEVVSFHKYQISSLLVMSIYPIFVFMVGELSFKDALHRLRIVLPIVCVAGVFNPFFDRQVVMTFGNIALTGGMISFLSLVIKGVLTVLSAYLLIATTTIEDICYSLQKIHVPKILVMVILLIYRYISLFLVEVSKVTTAYHLRAPKQKGVHHSAWGTLVGQMLLRSVDRANAVYDSMRLRGFRGNFVIGRKWNIRLGDIVYLLSWSVIFLMLRHTQVLQLIGNLFTRG